jgi:hypothetical protein
MNVCVDFAPNVVCGLVRYTVAKGDLKEDSIKRQERSKRLSATFLFGLFFVLEKGSHMFLRNEGLFTNCTTLKPTRALPFIGSVVIASDPTLLTLVSGARALSRLQSLVPPSLWLFT